jgi:hypothetical protein
MIAEWRLIISSTAIALRIERNHCASVKPVAGPFDAHVPASV